MRRNIRPRGLLSGHSQLSQASSNSHRPISSVTGSELENVRATQPTSINVFCALVERHIERVIFGVSSHGFCRKNQHRFVSVLDCPSRRAAANFRLFFSSPCPFTFRFSHTQDRSRESDAKSLWMWRSSDRNNYSVRSPAVNRLFIDDVFSSIPDHGVVIHAAQLNCRQSCWYDGRRSWQTATTQTYVHTEAFGPHCRHRCGRCAPGRNASTHLARLAVAAWTTWMWMLLCTSKKKPIDSCQLHRRRIRFWTAKASVQKK